MSTADWIGAATGVLTLLAALVGITRYVTRLQADQERLEAEQKRLESERADIEQRYREQLEAGEKRIEEQRAQNERRYADLDAVNKELRDLLRATTTGGMEAVTLKLEIDGAL
jgi:flagellar motility protein MotE (MotC chaperone)